ncbi:Exportin-6 [Podila verticillata]|nr:Exportin-6 [Podila verticillata]
MDALELLLAEFFGHGTSTDRKRIIEAQLESQRMSLDDCRYLLTHARSDYSAWFAASQFQKRIQNEWTHLDSQQQVANRTFLLQFLQQRFGSGATGSNGSSGAMGINGTSPGSTGPGLSSFVANKVIQLISDIALLDWPDRYQELFPDIHQLIQSSNKDHALLGWTLLEAVIQEFVGTYPAPGVGKSQRVHLTLAQQRRHVWENFKAQVPALLSLIVQHLDTCYTKTLVAPLSTEAPAPSPVEHSIWGNGSVGRRPSIAAQPSSPLMFNNNNFSSFSGARAVPGSMSNSLTSMNPGSFMAQSLFPGQGSDQNGAAHSYGKSPTTMLRKTLTNFLGPPTTNDHHPSQSPVSGSGFSLLQSRQRMGSISSIGQTAIRRSSINAAAYLEGRRNSVEATFVTGNKMDSHTRKTCLLALKALTTLLSCPGLDPRQVSFSASLTTVLKFSTLHQSKTVDLGILALSCLNGLVARPGFLASNQEVMTSAVRLMADLIRYFNEVRDGIDDIDERFTLEKISVDYLKICMDVWKSFLDIIIHSAAEISRPIPAHNRLRRVQEPVLYFMSALVEKFYKMKGATRSEDAFSTFEVEDEDDLEELTDLVEGFVGQVGEVFMEEVIEMLNPLLHQQLEQFSRREFDDCKTNFDIGRDYTSNLMIHLTRMTKLSVEFYLSTIGDASSPGKDELDLSGTITLALLNALLPLISWLQQFWKFESEVRAQSPGAETQIGKEIYQELAQIASHLFRSLLPSSIFNAPANSLQSTFSGRDSNALGTFLGPATAACSPMDRKLLVASIKLLGTLTVQVRPPADNAGGFSFWSLESTQLVATCLSQSVMANSNFMGLEFPPQSGATDGDTSGSEQEDRQGVTPTDDLYRNAYVALCHGIILDAKSGQEQGTLQEYFEVYKDDHDVSMDVLRFFKALVTSLFKQIGNGYCLGIARVLMDRFSTPPVLDTALMPISQHGLREQVNESLVILRSILKLPGKEITQSLPEFCRFLFGELGPKLMQATIQRPTSSPNPNGPEESLVDGSDNGAYDLMTLYFSTIQTLLTFHARYFFADTRVQSRSPSSDVGANPGVTHDRLQALQSCLEFLARGLHRPEPDIVRKVIEVLEALQDHPQCRLFDRTEFQQTFRFEFLQIVFRLALNHTQDLLLEEMAGLVHRLVKGDHASSSDEKFVVVWQTDLKRFVAGLEPSQVLTDLQISQRTSPSSSSPGGCGGSPAGSVKGSLVGVAFPDSTKEALWIDLARLGDEGTYREGLYDFVNDVQVYAQSLL